MNIVNINRSIFELNNCSNKVENGVDLKEILVQQDRRTEILKSFTSHDKVATTSPIPDSRIVCDVFEWSEEYEVKSKTSSAIEAYQSSLQNYKQDYLHTISAYRQIFEDCDKDIAYCQELIKNNQDTTQNDLLNQLLEQTETRRKNIANQAVDQLTGKAQFISEMTDLQTKAMKVMVPKEDVSRIDEIEARSMISDIFEKINKLDFNNLLDVSEQSNQSFSTLIDLLTPKT